MQAGRRERSWTFLIIAGLTLLPGCQYLSGSLAKLPKWKSSSSSELAHGPVGPLQASSFTAVKPTAEQKAEVQLAFARTVEREGDRQGAMKLYQQIVRSAPDHHAAYHRLAVLHDQEGNHQEAARYYRKAIQRAPQNAAIYADRGYSLYLQNQWPQAEQNLRQALQLDNTLARAHNNLGLLLARSGRQEEAMREFQLAGCSEPECRANLIHALMLDQRYGEAQQQCQLVLAAHNIPADVKQRLTKLSARITAAEQKLEAPPSQSQFLWHGNGQAVAHPSHPATARQVSYERPQEIRALPPLFPAAAR